MKKIFGTVFCMVIILCSVLIVCGVDKNDTQKVSEYNVEDYHIKGNGEDCTEALQELVDLVYAQGGGTIVFNQGIYACKAINIKSNVSFKGKGMGETTLKRLPGDNIDGAFIYVPNYAIGFSISDLSIYGNKENDDRDTIGLKFQDGTTWSFEGDIYDFVKDPQMVVPDNVERTYKYALIENIYVLDFKSHGIYIGNVNYAVMMNDFHSYNNEGCGLYNLSTDNMFTNCYLESNGQSGLYNEGGNCKFENVKSIWNGRNDHSAWGVLNKSRRCLYLNIEVQDNWCNGLYTNGADNSFVNVLSDTNGYMYAGPMSPQDCIMIQVTGTRNRIIGACSQYRTELDTVAAYALVMEDCVDCRIDVTVDEKCSVNGSIIDEQQCYKMS